MLSPESGCKIYLCTGQTDMRKGVNGLSILAQSVISDNLTTGALFVFRGKSADKINHYHLRDGSLSLRQEVAY